MRYDKDISSTAKLLTVSEVAQILHVHPNTVRVWSNRGIVKAYRIGYRRDRRFKPEDINRLLMSK